jgi:hypothetical protein
MSIPLAEDYGSFPTAHSVILRRDVYSKKLRIYFLTLGSESNLRQLKWAEVRALPPLEAQFIQ